MHVSHMPFIYLQASCTTWSNLINLSFLFKLILWLEPRLAKGENEDRLSSVVGKLRKLRAIEVEPWKQWGCLFKNLDTLSPIIMEVENGLIWKVTTTYYFRGPIFHNWDVCSRCGYTSTPPEDWHDTYKSPILKGTLSPKPPWLCSSRSSSRM